MLSIDPDDLDKISEAFYHILKGRTPEAIALPEDHPDDELKLAVGYINKFLA